MSKKKIILLGIGSLFLIIAIVMGYFLQVQAFLPHEKIKIILPFAPKYDDQTKMIPMGETIFHPKTESPNGHPGIDFQWDEEVPLISASDGIVTGFDHGSSNGIDIYVQTGFYNVIYKEMNESNVAVKVGQKVSKNDLIGYPDGITIEGRTHYQVHWEFASISPILDRYCPVTYFEEESQTRIAKIWDKMRPEDNQNMKKQFPNICSGDYFGRVD
jgi:murein DD-endopeptidase MepM/ murein hydrolase activator NlpD